jgi:hypothetical protein
MQVVMLKLDCDEGIIREMRDCAQKQPTKKKRTLSEEAACAGKSGCQEFT